MSSNKLISFVINLILIQMSHQLKCLDESNGSVDWFIVYKVPKLETSSLDTLRSGFGYSFISDKTIKSSNDWILSDKQINEKNSIFGQTIGSVINKLKKSSNSLSYVVYNDQTPDSVSSSSAHSKGLFAMDSNNGFWLSHSVPKFPSLSGSYEFPDSAKHNGQTAICVSFNSNDIQTLESIAIQLLLIRPKIYGISIQNDLINKSKLWLELKNKKYIKNITNTELLIKSENGVIFKTFAKSGKYSEDLYSALIANNLKEDLLVQSWRNGAGEKLDSDCTDKYKVNNVNAIRISNVKSARNGVDWNYTEDHSKWAITADDSADRYTCISDINRMKSQFKRGGGSVCIKSNTVWNIFKKTVESIEGCKTRSTINREISYELSCRDETGESVDWFIVYKFPKKLDSPPSATSPSSGYSYVYITDKTVDSGNWVLSSIQVTEENCIFGQTLKQLFSDSIHLTHVEYSDQPPGNHSDSSKAAHAKGVLAYEIDSGFWLVHSIPNFPETEGGVYGFPETGVRYGQTALCISLGSDKENLNNIAKHFLIMRPNIYNKRISDDLIYYNGIWVRLDYKDWFPDETHSHLTINSNNNFKFDLFAKNSDFNKDIYTDLIVSTIKQSLLVQSWQNGSGGKLGSDCSNEFTIKNIDRIGLIKGSWNASADHSKWGITAEENGSPMTCIADINRMKSQFKRGGGSVCNTSDKIWKLFKIIIEAIEGCDIVWYKKDKNSKKLRKPNQFSINILKPISDSDIS